MHVRIALALLLASIVTTSLARANDEPAPAPAPATTTTTSAEAEPAAPAPAPAPPAPPESGAPKKAERDVDHRYEGGLRAGVMMGGVMSPVNWFRSHANPAPSIGYDGGYVANKHVIFGAYYTFSPYSFDRKSGEQTIGDGTGWLMSGGFSLKGRFEINESVILRAGATVGLNASSQDGKMKDGRKFEMAGRGLNVGLTADAVWRASSKVGAVAQLSFISQPLGESTVAGYPTAATAEGADRDYRFSPKIFLTVGPELFLW